MNKFSQVLNILKKAAFGQGGEGTRGGHVIGHTRSGKPIYESSSHETHAAFSSQEHRDAMNHHHEIWSKTQERIAAIREQRPNWNPPKQIHDFLKHHYTAMQMHQSRAGSKEGIEARQAKNLAAPGPIKSKPYNTPSNIHKSMTADEESEIIKQNKMKPEASKEHKFRSAEWTHPNGHPRCIVCGDEERTGGMCGGLQKSQEITPFYAAVIVVDNSGKNFLLGKRKEDGIWTSPAGGAKVGEKPVQAAIREAFEEANLILDPRQFEELPMGYAHNYKPVHCFLVRLSPEQMSRIGVQNDPDKEVKEWKWLPIDGKLPEPMDNNRFGTLLNAKMHMAGVIMKSFYNMDVTEGMTQVNPAEVQAVNDNPHPMIEFIETNMRSYEPGGEPRCIGFEDSNLYLVRIDDGIYSGYVKRNEKDGTQETVANIDKMTIPDMVQFLRAKQIIKDAPAPKPATPSEIGMAYASEMDRLGEMIAQQEREAQEKAELYRLFPEPQTRGQEVMLRLMVEKLHRESKIIRKAKALPVGTVRQWGVYKYVKHNDGWVVMGGEHHGKLMGDFKSQPKYSDYARHHEKTSAKQDEPKESPKAPKADSEPKAEPKTDAPAPVDSPKAASEEDVKKLTQKLDSKVQEAKKEEDPAVEKQKAQEEYRQKNARLIEQAQASGAHTMSLKNYMEHARGKRRAELIEQNKARHGDDTESRVDRHLESRKRSYTKDFKNEHRRYTDAAHRSGMEVHPDAMAEYPGLSGEASLPAEIDSDLNKKTNMIQALDLGKTPKAVQKQFASHLNNCNKVIDSMGVKFKTPMTFKATGLTKLGKRTRGVFYDKSNTIELKDMSAAPKTLMHEIGHAIDYAMNEKDSPFMGRHSEMLTQKRADERAGGEPSELHKMYGELHDIVTQSDYYKQSSGKHFTYLVKPTEVFARAFEVYALHKAEQMGMPPEFMDTFIPDVFKVKDQSVVDLRKEIDKLVSPADYAKRQELAKQYNQKIEQTDGGWGVVPEEKQMEYKTKVSELMEKILSQDPIKKAMQEIDLLEVLQDSETFQKAQGLPVGSVRIWHGTKFIKQGDGHWVPMPSGQQAGQQPQSQGNAAVAQQPAPQQAQANLESQKQPNQPGEGQMKVVPHPTEHLKPKKGFGGHVEIHSKDLDHQLKNGPISIISAGRNPNHAEDRGLSDEHVNERYKRLEQDLKDHGYKYTKVKGHYGGEEDSFMVHHADENHMNDLGRKYNQDSVIHSNEGKNKLHFTTGEHAGKHHKGEGHEELPDAKDYFSEIKTSDGQKKKFSLGLDFGKHHEADDAGKKTA